MSGWLVRDEQDAELLRDAMKAVGDNPMIYKQIADTVLLREALAALKRSAVVIGIAAAQIDPAYRGANNVYDEGVSEVVTTITKLEQRLLSE